MYKRLLLLGDSQTQRGAEPNGWVNLIADKHCRQLDITNRGLSGYNTRWTLDNICNIIPAMPAYHYDLGVVWFGSNDAVKPGLSQHVGHKEYSSNLTQIVCKLVDCIGIQPHNLLVLTPPCIDQDMLDQVYPDSRTNERMNEYADIALSVAKDRHCEQADLYSLFTKHSGCEDLFTDGLHLSQRGNALVAQVVMKFLSERVPETLSIPDWKDFIIQSES